MLCSNIFLMKRVWSVHPTDQEEHRRISLTYKVPAVCLCWEHTSPRQENIFSYVWPKLRFWPCGQERKKKKQKTIHRDMTPKEQRPEWLWELIPSLCVLNVGFGESWEDLPSVPLTPLKWSLQPLFCFLDHFPSLQMDLCFPLFSLVLIHQQEFCLMPPS